VNFNSTFDFIVVGAGSAGCVVAARLSESGRHSVALIEAGGKDDSFWIHTPLGYGMLYDNPKLNWAFEADPEPELASHKNYQPRGRVLGGTGSINGMIYMRGQKEDFDLWRQLGNIGWSYDDVLPFYRKSEDNQRGASHYHGTGGPVRISDAPRHELADAFIAAAGQAGFARNDDFNGPSQDGFGYNQMTIRNGKRSSSVEFLRQARGRDNLTVLTDCQVRRLLFTDRRVTGIEIVRDGAVQSIGARKEVVVSAGAIGSPHLLQASGIGASSLLADLGIDIVADVPGVGENLQDHLFVPVIYRCNRPLTINDVVNNPIRKIAAGIQYLLTHTGPLAANASVCGGCIRTDPSLAAPDVKINMQMWNRHKHGRTKQKVSLAPYSSFGTNAVLLHPDNRGYVRINSPDPMAQPSMRFNLFKSENDHRTAVAALKILRGIMSQPAIAKYIEAEEGFENSDGSDEALLAYCRQNARSNHHAAGTCKMGVDDMAVVDPRLKVHGVEGLRVADASIMPRIVSGNTHGPAMMIGEKCAAMMLEDA
jgi:choline dehydrogenase